MADREPLTPEQQRAVEEFRRLRGADPFGPFIPLLASPDLMPRIAAVGEYLRYRSALPSRLSELAILITAAHWRQEFEWSVHAPIAAAAGISGDAMAAVWNGDRPAGLTQDQEALYELCIALHRDRKPDAQTLEQARATLGERGVIDAIAICGYYAMLAMILNAH